MPTYEYRCNGCSHEFEAEQRMSEDPLKKCPECGKSKLERLISATAFHLKGGGWYKDLYSSKQPTSQGKSEKSEAKSEGAGCGAGACGTGACSAAKAGSN